MTKIWDLNSKFNYYLQVELAVCDAYAKLGTIPSEAAKEIREKASFSVERIDEIEREVRHDVIAFLTCVNESLGDLGRYVHVGLTSSDVIDTAFALQIQDSGKIIKTDLDKTISTLKNLANLHKNKEKQQKNTNRRYLINKTFRNIKSELFRRQQPGYITEQKR